MPSPSLRPLLALTVVFAAACGSRSGVLVSDTAAGGGGSTSSTTGGTTSSSTGGTTSTVTTGGGGGDGCESGGAGAGGSIVVDCSILEVKGPPAFLEGGFGFNEHHPLWVPSSDDGQQVTLLTSQQQAEGPEGDIPPTRVMHTTLQPWKAFPSGGALGPTDMADAEGGTMFTGGRAAGGKFALLFANATPPGDGLRFSSQFVPFESTPPLSEEVSSTADLALFAVKGPCGHLLGMESIGVSGGADGYVVETVFVGNDGSLTGPATLGCATGAMFADAVPWDGGWLVALSNGGPFGGGGGECPDPGLEWPDDVQIVFTDGKTFTETGTVGAPGGATDVKMAARSDGAWVVVGTPPGQVVNGMFLGARITQGGEVDKMFPVGGGDPNLENPMNGTLTAASLGDQLAVAWIDFGGDKGPFIHVKVFDPDGNPTGQAQVFAGTSLMGAPSLLGSPSGAELVLAWAETPDQGMNDGDKIRAVRIDCLPGL